ncbi:hypothetical protein BDA96_10G211600 [Sorghum bicolor]|uniref:Uncharacterized protein n=2 Tax=Sorghum bicolor TaxID=4558 RepID=A0A921Q492_SORBI|nr:hypothetical protein BDA96_10G211600 [Sorghum bicolor]KXG20139.1 hypothetical protein SORBI_3010G161100 [Sorghum bicolor]
MVWNDGNQGVQVPAADGQGADGDQDDAAADGMQAEGLSNAPPTVNDGGTEGVQTDAANGQQVVSTHADMSLFWCVNTCRCVGR